MTRERPESLHTLFIMNPHDSMLHPHAAGHGDVPSTLRQIFDRGHRESLNWQPYGSDGRDRVQIHWLYDARQDGKGPAAALLRYLPGARVPQHLHPGFELILVLEGELINDAGVHGPGTLEICPPGNRHALYSHVGCVFLVVWEQPVIRLQ